MPSLFPTYYAKDHGKLLLSRVKKVNLKKMHGGCDSWACEVVSAPSHKLSEGDREISFTVHSIPIFLLSKLIVKIRMDIEGDVRFSGL